MSTQNITRELAHKIETKYGPIYAFVQDAHAPVPVLSDLDIELNCFLEGRMPENGGIGKAGHFMEAAKILWNKKTKPFVWHPWAEKATEEACANNYLALIGCASSGKTDWAAIWGIINWLADPTNTMVLVTSTSLKDSRQRIWGSIREYYLAHPGLPGKFVDSLGILKLPPEYGKSDKSGITLIPGEKKKEKEAVGKIIGRKNKRVIMIADELPELSEALMTAAFYNLATNPYFQFIGIGNFNSIDDPLGTFSEPKDGWGSVTPEDTEWDTHYGKCIRFDGTQRPNVLLDRDVYPFIYNTKNLKEHLAKGENTAQFWRMVRSFPCPSGEEHKIFSDADFIAGKAYDEPIWYTTRTKVAFLDPGFTNDGDESVVYFAWYGQTSDGKETVAFIRFDVLKENVNLKKDTHSFQIARQYRDMCLREGIIPANAGWDNTGAGLPFGEILREVWSPDVVPCTFSGAASEMAVGQDGKKAKEFYVNKVTELWYIGSDLMRAGQIRGVSKELARDWKARKYTTVKSPSGLRIEAESKKRMKLRIGRSPGKGDAAAGVIHICRERFGLLVDSPIQMTLEREGSRLESEVDAIYGESASFSEPEIEFVTN